MHEKIEQALWEDISHIDETIFSLADALDVKASILLVLTTFLGAVAASILVLPNLPAWVKLAQAVAVAALTLTVVCCLAALWPATFETPPSVEKWRAFITEAAGELKDDPHGISEVLRKFHESRVKAGEKRIAANKRITTRKAAFNKAAFYFSALAILMDIVTLVWLAHTRF
jgi:hypothetical protein